jgi:hypothetical protein
MQQPLFTVEQHDLTSNDYYTPKWVFETLDLEFDLDVVAPPGGIPHIPAKQYFTQKDDGLSQDWFGRVWMNPPFSKAQPWVERFVDHGNGVGLIGISKSNWFDALWASDVAISLIPRSLKFIDPRGGAGTIMLPCILIAMGNENIDAIGRIGKTR